METATIITLLCGIAAVIISIGNTFQTRRSSIERLKILQEYENYKRDLLREYEEYKRENERRFTVLETNWNLFIRVIEKDLGKMIHSPHRRELDELLEKNEEGELTREEALNLAVKLDETLKDPHLRPGEEVGIKLYKAAIVARYRLVELIL